MDNFSVHTPVNMAPTGIASFAKCPICADLRCVEANVSIERKFQKQKCPQVW